MKIKILNVEIDGFTKPQFEKVPEEALTGDKLVRIGKVNTEFLLRSKESDEFAKTLSEFEVKIADGSGVLWAAKFLSLSITKTPVMKTVVAWALAKYSLFMLAVNPAYCKKPIPERFPGQEAFYLMLEAADRTKSKVYFFGAEKGILETAVKEIKTRYPSLVIVGWHDGYNYTDKEILDDINRTKPQLLVVALGSPKQEYWIRDNAGKMPSVRIAVGEGGTFDYIAGLHKRPPVWMQRAGLEWFWRVFMNRDRTGNSSRLERIWRAVPVFIYTIVREKINEK